MASKSGETDSIYAAGNVVGPFTSGKRNALVGGNNMGIINTGDTINISRDAEEKKVFQYSHRSQ